MSAERPILVLFDVDGTLTPARKSVTQEMLTFLRTLRGKVTTGMVGGSDLVKQREQLGEDVLELFDFVFPENGLAAFHLGKSIGKTSFRDFLGEARLKELINFALLYIANLDIPIKRGTFIEFRNGMLNVSPIGRNCSQEERDEFERYDLANGIRATMVKVLEARFANFGLKYSIGGQISFDVFPIGWDKTYALKYVDALHKEIHFFGDKTFPGGNDYEIFSSPRVQGHTVTSPEDTMAQCKALFGPL